MPLTPEKRRAYEKAEYAIHGEPEIVLRVGERSAGLDALLAEANAASAAFISSANPYGELTNELENQAARRAFETVITASWGWFPGEGRDPDPGGEWPAEPSALILDIPLDEAMRIGRAFGQNAIVFVEKGRAPELVVLV